jgi:hypothetical protein
LKIPRQRYASGQEKAKGERGRHNVVGARVRRRRHNIVEAIVRRRETAGLMVFLEKGGSGLS